MPKHPITWLDISTSAVEHNIKQFLKILSPQTQLMAVVKSNAYGHGLVPMAKLFAKNKIKWLGTVNLDEALALRANGIKNRILVLSFFDPDKLSLAVKKNITLTIYSYDAAVRLNKLGQKLKRKVTVHIKIDTGTTRLGVLPGDSIALMKKISQLPYIRLEGIFSHLADAENPDQTYTDRQLATFNKLLQAISESGIKIPFKHIACSAAAILNRHSHFSLVRPGISLYGLWSVEKDGRQIKKIHRQFNLQPALSWHTTVIQVKNVPAKTAVGYGRTYKSATPMKIAVLPVGYWDGYDRKLSNRGEVLIHGKRCPLRGRVCMNLVMVDVSRLPRVRAGDRATLLGKSGKQEITAEELAAKIGTINYEVVTRINPQIIRIYK